MTDQAADSGTNGPAGLRAALRGGRGWILLAILIVGAILRFWDLGGVPPGLFRDEAEKGYTALELWRTGRHAEFAADGSVVPTRLLPAFVEVGGVQTSAIYQYLSAPLVGLLGLSRTTTRLVAALCGWLTILAAWAVAVRLQEGGHLAWRRGGGSPPAADGGGVVPLVAAAFTAVGPTHVLFSRWAQQGITVPLFFTVGVVAVLSVPVAAERHRRALAAGGGLALAAAFYGYAPARLVVPLLLLGLWWEMGGDLRRLVRAYWPAAALFFLFALPVLGFALTEGTGRFNRVSVLAGRGPLEAAGLFLANYAAHFDPRFLFVAGDANPRHGLPFAGLMGWAETPFFLLGVWTLVRGRGRAGTRLLTVWLLAAPAAASLTADGIPHALRSILFLPVVHLVSARGAGLLAAWAGERRAAAAAGAAAVVTGVLAGAALSGPVARDGHAWQHGPLEALAVMDRHNPAGPNYLVTDYAVYYILFHEQPDPRDFQEKGLEALRAQPAPPGAPLPEGALVAHPPFQMFARAQGIDVPALGGDASAPPAMMVRTGW